MEISDLVKKITNDLAVDLSDEFDRNFERKSFFTKSWPSTKISNSRGSLLNRTGNLRRSIRYSVIDNQIKFSSSLPYASIHNEGGELIVTKKMKSYFWAMYYKASGAIKATPIKGKESKSKKNISLSAEASKWKSLALMPIGHKIKVEKRQFIGDHPQVRKIVQNVLDTNMEIFNQELAKKFKR